jgi:hypothetical protein
MVESIEGGITQVTATNVKSVGAITVDNGTFDIQAVADVTPQLDIGMRNQSTNSTTETTLYTTTTTAQGNAAILIAGHSVVGGTSTFWVRATNSSGAVECTGSTSATSATKIIGANIPVANGAVYVWDADNSVGAADSAIIDQTSVTNGLSSYFLVARYIIYPALNVAIPQGTIFTLNTGLLTQLFIQQASNTATFAVIVYGNGYVNTSNLGGESAINLTFTAAQIYNILFTNGSFATGEAIGINLVGNLPVVS